MSNGKEKLYRVTVTGVVVAVSHVLLCPQQCFFIKILKSKPLCIRVSVEEHFRWQSLLKVGVGYRFSGLIPMALFSGTDEEVQFVEATPESLVQEVLLAFPKSVQDICMAVVSYTGTVTDSSLSSLGLYKLHEDSMLCTSFIAHKACVESFKCMDSIVIYNAHSRTIDGIKYYIMCAGSYAVSQQGNITQPGDSSTIHPIVAFVLAKGLSFNDFLWLMKIYLKLKNLLDQILVLGNNLYRKCVFEIMSHLIFDNPAASESSVTCRSFIKEFLLNDHKCAPLVAQRHPELQILTPEDCFNRPILKETDDKFWIYDIHHTISSEKGNTSYAVIGRLNVEEASPRLTLSDGVTNVRCVLIGASDCCGHIKSYVKKTVMIRRASVVVEQFRLSAAESEVGFKNYVYLLLSPQDIYPICDSLENVAESPLHSQDNSKSISINENRNAGVSDVESVFLSQHFVIHHMSTPIIFNGERQFYCLVSLLGLPVESNNLSEFINEKLMEKGRLHMLCMKRNMLQYYPFLFENRVYEIKFPRSYGVHLFDKRVNFPALSSGAVFLPFTEGVIIPNLCSIEGPFTSPNLPGDSLMDKEIYRIRDAPTVPFGDVVHLQGVVVFRSHQTPRYSRKRKINDENYGVPVEKNIIVELRDEESDETIRIYLIEVSAKLYPLALLRGSRVRLKFMEKRVSQKNFHFYQSTCFTCVQILECSEGSSESFLVEDGSGEAYMTAKDENVQKLLGFSESEWKELGVAATKNEFFFNHKKYSYQSDQPSSSKTKEDVDQAVFKRLCKEVELKPWHILCKKFVDEGNGDPLKLFCLNVQDIDLVRAESLSQ